MSAVEQDVAWLERAVHDMYDAYLTRDRARADSYIAQDVTVWDTEHEPLVHGLAGLDELRDGRPEGSVESVAGIDVTQPVIDVWGDMALVRLFQPNGDVWTVIFGNLQARYFHIDLHISRHQRCAEQGKG